MSVKADFRVSAQDKNDRAQSRRSDRAQSRRSKTPKPPSTGRKAAEVSPVLPSFDRAQSRRLYDLQIGGASDGLSRVLNFRSVFLPESEFPVIGQTLTALSRISNIADRRIKGLAAKEFAREILAQILAIPEDVQFADIEPDKHFQALVKILGKYDGEFSGVKERVSRALTLSAGATPQKRVAAIERELTEGKPGPQRLSGAIAARGVH